MELGIAQVGLSEPDSQRLRAVLGMAVMNDTALRRRWKLTDAESANLVVMDMDSGEAQAIIDASHSEGDQVYAVLAGEADDVPAGFLKLAWPIRLENVLQLLRTVESNAPEPIQSSRAPSPGNKNLDNGLLQLASILREDEHAGSSTAWRVEGVSDRSIYVSPGNKVFYFDESLLALREIPPDIEVSFCPVPIEDIVAKPGKKPLAMLQWLVGLQTGPLGLLPWINQGSPMILRRYPAFHVLHHSPEHRRIAAVLSRPRKDVKAVASLASVDSALACSFVNAANLCGYLVPIQGDSIAGGAPIGSIRRPRSLFKSFRKALGIKTANA